MKLLRGFTKDNIHSHCTVMESGCWEWKLKAKVGDGYGMKHLRGRWILAHRLTYELFFGPIPAALQVMHRCDNPSCINPEHLTLGTNRDNQIDSMKKGRWKKPPTLFGKNHPAWKHGKYAV